MNKLLLSMARQIHRRLVAHNRTDLALAMLGDVREAQWRFNIAWQRLQTAQQRRWHEAARVVRRELFEKARELNEKLCETIAQESVSPPPLPSLWMVIEELKQLHDEFEEVELCMNQHGQRRVKAVTEPITLEDVELGRFSIELDLHRLSTRCTSAAFDCKALDPNYAASNSDVTHAQSSYDLFYRAAVPYAAMAKSAEFLKISTYADIMGPRLKGFVTHHYGKTIFGDLESQQALDLFYALSGNDAKTEPKLETLADTGMSPQYVFQETSPCVH